MKYLWFLLGYGVAAWLAHREAVEAGIDRAERYANYVQQDDMEDDWHE